MMPVSIVIPAWNEGGTIGATVLALRGIDYDPGLCDVIVVAGGGDGTRDLAEALSPEMAAFNRYLVLGQAPNGKNAAIQTALKHSMERVIVLLDGDTLVTADWLANMLAPIVRGDCDLTIANPLPIKRTWVSDYYMIIKAHFLDRISTYSGNAMAFRADIVKNRLDYFFDVRVKVGVDYLLAKRFIAEGLRVRFAKDAVVHTHIPSALKYFAASEFRWLTALISIEGVNYNTLARNIAVVSAALLIMPVVKVLFFPALLFNAAFVVKQVRVFHMGRKRYEIPNHRILGFLALSYLYHAVGLASNLGHLLGVSKYNYLWQGQRY